MSLALSCIRHADEQFVNAITTPLTGARCKIGRGQECDIVLEDPTRRVSRDHASVSRQGDAYVLSVDSKVNPVVVNDKTMTGGQTVVLSVGDVIGIGDYVFTIVNAGDEGGTAPGAPADPFGAFPSGAGSDPFSAFPSGAGAGGSDLNALFATPARRPEPVKPGRSGIDTLIGGHSQQRAEDPLLGMLGGGAAGRPSQASDALASEGDDSLMQLLGGSGGSTPDSSTSALTAVFSSHSAGSVASIDNLLGGDAFSSSDPLGIGVPDHHSARPGFGGGRGGSLELDHVHDINLPFSPPQARAAPARGVTPPAGVPAPPPRAATPPARAAAPPARSAPIDNDDPLAALLGEPRQTQRPAGPADDPLGLFGSPAPAGAAAAKAASSKFGESRHAQPTAAAVDIPLDFLDEPAPASAPAATAAAANLGRSGPAQRAAGSADDPLGFFDAPASAGAPPAKAAPANFGAPKPAPRRGGSADDPLGFFNEPSSADAPAANAAADDSLQEPTYVIRPQAPDAPDAPARAAGPAAAAAAGASMAQAAQAFLQGAAMEGVQVGDADAEIFLRESGAVCRAAVEGIMGLLLARATVKDQLRVSDRTMVAARENNALKLIENMEEAVKFVFDRSSRTDAFLPPDKAVADACTDLQVHEIALVAGMRSALIGAVKRFNPSVIEKKLDKGGGASMLANKKAKLWDTFLTFYEETNRDAEDNFDRVFGADFLRAYHEQLKRLKS